MRSEQAVQRDIEVLREFTGLYCQAHHGTAGGALCDDCRELLAYAEERRRKCPHDPKPRCSACRIHCYREPHRARIREVMKFGGLHHLKHARLGRLVKLALGLGAGRTPVESAGTQHIYRGKPEA